MHDETVTIYRKDLAAVLGLDENRRAAATERLRRVVAIGRGSSPEGQIQDLTGILGGPSPAAQWPPVPSRLGTEDLAAYFTQIRTDLRSAQLGYGDALAEPSALYRHGMAMLGALMAVLALADIWDDRDLGDYASDLRETVRAVLNPPVPPIPAREQAQGSPDLNARITRVVSTVEQFIELMSEQGYILAGPARPPAAGVPDAEVLGLANRLLSKYFHPSRGGLRLSKRPDPVADLQATRYTIRLAIQMADRAKPAPQGDVRAFTRKEGGDGAPGSEPGRDE